MFVLHRSDCHLLPLLSLMKNLFNGWLVLHSTASALDRTLSLQVSSRSMSIPRIFYACFTTRFILPVSCFLAPLYQTTQS